MNTTEQFKRNTVPNILSGLEIFKSVKVIQIKHTLDDTLHHCLFICSAFILYYILLASYQVYAKKKKKINQIHATIWVLRRGIPYLFCGLISFIFFVKSFAKNKSEK